MQFSVTVRPRRAILLLCIVLAATFLLNCSYIDQAGNSKSPNTLRRVRTLAGLNREFGEPFGVAIRNGEIFVSDGEKGQISRVDKNGTVTVFAAGFHAPSA